MLVESCKPSVFSSMNVCCNYFFVCTVNQYESILPSPHDPVFHPSQRRGGDEGHALRGEDNEEVLVLLRPAEGIARHERDDVLRAQSVRRGLCEDAHCNDLDQKWR